MSSLVIKIGSSVETLQICNPNDEDNPMHIANEEFDGHVLIRVNDFHGIVPQGYRRIPTTEYFDGHRRKMSFQFQGKFSKPYTADDLVWSSDWDEPLNVPKLMGLFTKFWSMTDPGSYNDLKSPTPFMRSYVATAMCSITSWPSRHEGDEMFRPIIVEDINHLLPPDPSQPSSLNGSLSSLNISGTPPTRGSSLTSPTGSGSASPKISFAPRGSSLAMPAPEKDWKLINKIRAGGEDSVKDRRKYFSNEENRRSTVFKPGFIYGFEVFNPYFDPNTFKIKIPGLTIDMLKVTNGQPMRTRLMTKDGEVVFFVVEVSASGGVDEDKDGDIPSQ